MDKINAFLQKPFFRNKYTLLGLWMIIAIAAAVTKFIGNNYLIYKFSFWNLIHEDHLYTYHPEQFGDLHHYGPIFSVLMCPFAVLPDWLGMLLWDIALALFLYWVIRQSKFKWGTQLFMLWFCAHELLTALQMQQINVAIAGMIILSYCYIQQEKDQWAAFFIVLATFIKLFGVVGLAFFFFSKHKKKLILWLIIWSVVMFLIPMLFSSPEYIIRTYQEWFTAIADKNHQSLLSSHQNISLLGMIRKIGYCCYLGGHEAYMQYFRAWHDVPPTDINFWTTYSDRWLILAGLVLFFMPYLRFSQWKNESFRRMFLASVMMFLCLFSTSTESSGYIIGLTGVAIWFTGKPGKHNKWDISLMVLAFILTSMSPSDLFPQYLRQEWVWPFALKSLPVSIAWFVLIWQMMTKNYVDGNVDNNVLACGKQQSRTDGDLDYPAEPIVKKAE